MFQPGTVALVGAGPGDPGLISLRGVELLQQADLVLYDGLVNPLILRHTHAVAERTCRVVGPDGQRLDQNELNRRLIEAARQGKRVVRLKGGDPFIFGRGSEEAQALAEAGIPFEVVPGITAATAAAAYAGISVTHRRHASAVAFVTGHEDPAKDESHVDYALLAKFAGTLVFYMGLRRLPEIVSALLANGKDPQTPAALICRGTWPTQNTVTATLEELPAAATAAGAVAPSLIVIGECVTLRDEIRWFEQRPLFGLQIGVARAAEQANDLVDPIIERGALPVLLPAIEIRPPDDWTAVDDAVWRLPEFDWVVFTSANGVDAFVGRVWELGGDARSFGEVQIAAIGPATAAALERRHLRADLVPDAYRAEELAAALAPHCADARVLWPRADRGRDVLPEQLKAAGADVETVVVYRNCDVERWPPDVISQLERGELDWICLSSPSIARRVAALLPEAVKPRVGRELRLASISPVTTAAAKEAGLPISAEATVYTWPGILDAIEAARRSGIDAARRDAIDSHADTPPRRG